MTKKLKSIVSRITEDEKDVATLGIDESRHQDKPIDTEKNGSIAKGISNSFSQQFSCELGGCETAIAANTTEAIPNLYQGAQGSCYYEYPQFGNPKNFMYRDEHMEKMELNEQRHFHKKDIIYTKDSIQRDKLKFLDDLQLRRQLATYSIFCHENTLRICIFNAEGQAIGSKQVCSAYNLSLTIYHCRHGYGPEWAYKISWGIAGHTENIYLNDAKMSPLNLIKVLEKAGIVIQVSRSKREIIATLIYSYLFKESKIVEVPRKYGWNKIGERWHWVSRKKRTMVEVMKKCGQK